MPSSCLPCWSSKLASHFDSEDPNHQSPPAKGATGMQDDDGFGKPTPKEYAGEAAKEFLKVLQAVADQIPVPGVSAAVKIAMNLILACEDSHATLERAEELKLRIKSLVTILVDELKGKKADEIQQKLQEDIRALERDLKYIQTKLDEIAAQHALLVIFFRSFNDEKVKKCINRLNNALESFNLARQINDANLLTKLEQQILTFHGNYQKSLDQLQVTMDDVKAILAERLPTTSSPSGLRSRGSIPANTGIFRGRDALVEDLVRALTVVSDGLKRPRVCLLGPGGMGKTSTALAVMAHSDLRDRFPTRSQVWVPCVKATSVSLLLDTLYSSLGMTRNTGDALNDIISELEFSEPLILLLDNFETPWNVDGGRSDTVRILRDIEQIAHITLFLTMRSSLPPCHDIRWHSIDLGAVDEDAGLRIYSDLYAEGSNDPELPELLDVVGNMPLAITLMATVGKATGLRAGELVEEYRRIGTAMLGAGSDAQHNVEICISLSVDSPPMKKRLEAYELLATLAMLPVGTTYDALVRWWARGVPNLTGALQVLRETALVERRRTKFFVLPVIRSYILDPSRFPAEVNAAMIESACDALYKTHAAALSTEEGNLQSVLLDTVVPETSHIEALLTLARYQLSTRPRLEVIEHTLMLVRRMTKNETLLGDVLECYGWILRYIARHDDSIKQLKLARNTFLSIPDKKRAAQCLLKIVEVHCFIDPDFHSNSRMVAEAKSDFEELKDTHGFALSLYYSGIIYGQDGRNATGIGFLVHAREIFRELGDALNYAHCSFRLSVCYYWYMKYEDAVESATAAVREYERLGQYAGDAARQLGRTFFSKGDYADALRVLIQALETDKASGLPLAIAQSLEYLGRTWAKIDRKADAKHAYKEAMRYYSTLQSVMGNLGITCCRFLTRALEEPLLIPSDEEREVLAGFYQDFQYL